MRKEEKSALVIINPNAGKRKTKKHLLDITAMLNKSGYSTTVRTTGARNDARIFVKEYAKDFDIVVCRGGDGTFNEVVNGMMTYDYNDRKPIGYIPSGTTNDLAKTLNIPVNSRKAVSLIIGDRKIRNDVGLFNDKYFAYVASFGVCTRASYETPSSVKHIFGHAAYMVNGLMDLRNTKPIHTKLNCDGEEIEADIAFGSVSNSMSLAGALSIGNNIVNLNDGKFEVILARMPNSTEDWKNTIDCLINHHYDDKYVILRQSSEITIEHEYKVPWTVDGEYAGTERSITIKNLNNAIEIFR